MSIICRPPPVTDRSCPIFGETLRGVQVHHDHIPLNFPVLDLLLVTILLLAASLKQCPNTLKSLTS